MNIDKEKFIEWKTFWESQPKDVLEVTALVRSIECTNGCIQYAFRDQEKNALPVEQTRECMKLSMGVMKNKVLPMPDGSEIVIPENVHPIMDRCRDIYIRGFKQGDSDALSEFYALSISHFQVLGKDLVDDQFKFIREHFLDLFSDYWLEKGKQYIYYMGGFSLLNRTA